MTDVPYASLDCAQSCAIIDCPHTYRWSRQGAGVATRSSRRCCNGRAQTTEEEEEKCLASATASIRRRCGGRPAP
eukprot:COSAG05_NODE_497_length_9246_cov_6.935343_7_plen_75_part_00